MNFQDFINKTLGKAIDVDGVPKGQKYQCVDLAKYFNILYNPGFQIICTDSGYAKDWATQKNMNGILKYFTETQINNMIAGTLVVYGNCKIAPDSHIGFFLKDNGDGTFQMLHQNAYGCHYVTINNMPYAGIIGAFIPNQLLKKEEPKKESGNKYINIPESIPARNVYDDNLRFKTTIKPQKFGGLSYKILSTKDSYAKILTKDFGEVYVKVTAMTTITDSPKYKNGNY